VTFTYATFFSLPALLEQGKDPKSPDRVRYSLLKDCMDNKQDDPTRPRFGALTLIYRGRDDTGRAIFEAPNQKGRRSTEHEHDPWEHMDTFMSSDAADALLVVGKTYHFATAVDPVRKTKKGKDIRHVLLIVTENLTHKPSTQWSASNNSDAESGAEHYTVLITNQNDRWLRHLQKS